MIDQCFIEQLQKAYRQYLSDIINDIPFTAIRLRGYKKKPETTVELYQAIESFLKYEKNSQQLGWVIEWEQWQSKKLGCQRWPSSVTVVSEEDYLYLLNKQHEVTLFKQVFRQLLNWNAHIAGWLANNPFKVLELQHQWSNICAVVDYLLNNEVHSYYLRSLPVPVHTKFIQQNKSVILSLLTYFDNVRFQGTESKLEKALQVQEKPHFHAMRWLDSSLAEKYSSGMSLLAVYPAALRLVSWEVKEVWLVENETNLYLLPERHCAVAIFSKGYALQEFRDIPFLQMARLLYWGDLDEDGFIMLHQFRQLYSHTQSVLMDEETVLFHKNEMEAVPFRFKQTELHLFPAEEAAYKLLKEQNGRIEQEKLQQAYVQLYLSKVL